VERSSAEIREPLRWQLVAPSKLFRPLTILAARRATGSQRSDGAIMRTVLALEFFHNVSLIVDDILDRSRYRRQRLTLHCRFGELRALMSAGYLAAGAFRLVASDPYAVGLLGTLMQRLAVAECLQWRLRRQPLGVPDWQAIAAEDTGSMFEVCARLGTRDGRLARYGQLLGMLYHGCDDVADVRGGLALGGGGSADLRDGILTLPVAVAARRPRTASLFRKPDGAATRLRRALVAALPEAERQLDDLADEARAEAQRNASDPRPLLILVEHTRALARA
jgi:geranylgeranyl pyrophosphate synthase